MRLERICCRNVILSTFLLFIFSTSLVPAQIDSARYRPDVLRFADGVTYTLSSPVRWNGKDLLLLSSLVAGTAALTLLDQPVQHFWQQQDNRFLDGVERVGYHYGKPYSAVAVTAGFYVTGLIFKSEWAKETGLMLGTSIFSSSVLMGVLKSAAGRARPMVNDHLAFRPFNNSPSYHAFPSGHSSVAFGISLLLAKRIDSVPVKIFFYALAGTTAVSRMYSDSHWLSDIAFGGAIAWFCADTVMSRIEANRFRKVRAGRDAFVWKVYPYPGGITLLATL